MRSDIFASDLSKQPGAELDAGGCVLQSKWNRFCFCSAVVASLQSRRADELVFPQSSMQAFDLFVQR